MSANVSACLDNLSHLFPAYWHPANTTTEPCKGTSPVLVGGRLRAGYDCAASRARMQSRICCSRFASMMSAICLAAERSLAVSGLPSFERKHPLAPATRCHFGVMNRAALSDSSSSASSLLWVVCNGSGSWQASSSSTSGRVTSRRKRPMRLMCSVSRSSWRSVRRGEKSSGVGSNPVRLRLMARRFSACACRAVSRSRACSSSSCRCRVKPAISATALAPRRVGR